MRFPTTAACLGILALTAHGAASPDAGDKTLRSIFCNQSQYGGGGFPMKVPELPGPLKKRIQDGPANAAVEGIQGYLRTQQPEKALELAKRLQVLLGNHHLKDPTTSLLTSQAVIELGRWVARNESTLKEKSEQFADLRRSLSVLGSDEQIPAVRELGTSIQYEVMADPLAVFPNRQPVEDFTDLLGLADDYAHLQSGPDASDDSISNIRRQADLKRQLLQMTSHEARDRGKLEWGIVVLQLLNRHLSAAKSTLPAPSVELGGEEPAVAPTTSPASSSKPDSRAEKPAADCSGPACEAVLGEAGRQLLGDALQVIQSLRKSKKDELSELSAMVRKEDIDLERSFCVLEAEALEFLAACPEAKSELAPVAKPVMECKEVLAALAAEQQLATPTPPQQGDYDPFGWGREFQATKQACYDQVGIKQAGTPSPYPQAMSQEEEPGPHKNEKLEHLLGGRVSEAMSCLREKSAELHPTDSLDMLMTAYFELTPSCYDWPSDAKELATNLDNAAAERIEAALKSTNEQYASSYKAIIDEFLSRPAPSEGQRVDHFAASVKVISSMVDMAAIKEGKSQPAVLAFLSKTLALADEMSFEELDKLERKQVWSQLGLGLSYLFSIKAIDASEVVALAESVANPYVRARVFQSLRYFAGGVGNFR